ncbi:MAG: hypothetical protein RIB59_04590 [Rhodospirillales bacterium]
MANLGQHGAASSRKRHGKPGGTKPSGVLSCRAEFLLYFKSYLLPTHFSAGGAAFKAPTNAAAATKKAVPNFVLFLVKKETTWNFKNLFRDFGKRNSFRRKKI